MTSHPPEEAARPPRIILPGSEPRGVVLGPDGRPIASPQPAEDTERREEPEEPGAALPAYPRLRPLEMFEAEDRGRPVVVLQDPSGIAPESVAISAEALPILVLLNGEVALDEICELVDRESKDTRAGESVRRLVADLDQRLLLESPRYFAALARARAAYRAEPVRPPVLAGICYPESVAELASFLTAHDAVARSWRDGRAPAPGLATSQGDAAASVTATTTTDAPPRAVAAPHLDPRRAGPLIARAYLEYEPRPGVPTPDVFFVFGTGHSLVEALYASTTKSFATPIGAIETDRDAVDKLRAAVGEDLFDEEMSFASEHSLEFACLALRHRLAGRAFRIVPLLFGGFHQLLREDRKPADEPRLETLFAAIREAARDLDARGSRVAFVASVDLSHVGARFGDAVDIDSETLSDVERADRAVLDAALRGDAEGWFEAIARRGDETRICGFSAMYAMLRSVRPGAGRLLGYQQSVEEESSVVTCAAISWPGAPSS